MFGPQKPTLKSKEIVIDVEANKGRPAGCPNCGKDKYVGFSTSFGAFKRCTLCNYEWAMGGLSYLADKTKEDKEFLIEMQTSQIQDEAMAIASAAAEDAERIAQVRDQEKFSGHHSNRTVWDGWEDIYDE